MRQYGNVHRPQSNQHAVRMWDALGCRGKGASRGPTLSHTHTHSSASGPATAINTGFGAAPFVPYSVIRDNRRASLPYLLYRSALLSFLPSGLLLSLITWTSNQPAAHLHFSFFSPRRLTPFSLLPNPSHLPDFVPSHPQTHSSPHYPHLRHLHIFISTSAAPLSTIFSSSSNLFSGQKLFITRRPGSFSSFFSSFLFALPSICSLGLSRLNSLTLPSAVFFPASVFLFLRLRHTRLTAVCLGAIWSPAAPLRPATHVWQRGRRRLRKAPVRRSYLARSSTPSWCGWWWGWWAERPPRSSPGWCPWWTAARWPDPAGSTYTQTHTHQRPNADLSPKSWKCDSL